MNWRGSLPSFEPLRLDSPELWLIGCLFFGMGDVVTTGFGLGMAGVTEANPLVAPLLRGDALLVMGVLKIVTLGGCFVLWKYIPRPHRVGIPLALSVVGVSVTLWNLHVLVFAVSP